MQTVSFATPSVANSQFNVLEITNSSSTGVVLATPVIVTTQLLATTTPIGNIYNLQLTYQSNPGAPAIGIATGGNAQAAVSFTAPTNNGGSAITGYTVTSNPAGGMDSNAGSTALTHTITGVINGTSYTFTVHATNATGNSVESGASNSVIPNKASQSISAISITPTTLVVNGTTTASATGGASGNAVTFTSTTTGVCTVSGTNGSTITGKAAGICTLAADQVGNDNFNAATTVKQSITIGKATTSVTWGTPAPITYGIALSATQLNATNGGISGTFAYTPALGMILNAGTQMLSVTFTPTDTTNYNSSTGTVNLTVNKATLVITANNVTRAYGAANPATPGFTAPLLVTGDIISGVTYSYAAGAVPSAAVETNYSITPSAAVFSSGNASNYIISYVAGTLSITGAASFTVSATAGENGSIAPASQIVVSGNTASLTVTPNSGYTAVVSGCGGTLNGGIYTTGTIVADCPVSATFTAILNANQWSLIPGWNLIGNSVEAALDVTTTFNDVNKVITVWKWIVANGKWAFYTPSMNSTDLGSYATSKGYGVLSLVNGGEGFWVNAKATFTVPMSNGVGVQSASFAPATVTPVTSGGSHALPHGWSLIATGDVPTPSSFDASIATVLSVQPSAGTSNVYENLTTLWAWDAVHSNWYFWAPSLVNSGGLSGYIANKNYLDFSAMQNGVLSPATGFWVNMPP